MPKDQTAGAGTGAAGRYTTKVEALCVSSAFSASLWLDPRRIANFTARDAENAKETRRVTKESQRTQRRSRERLTLQTPFSQHLAKGELGSVRDDPCPPHLVAARSLRLFLVTALLGWRTFTFTTPIAQEGGKKKGASQNGSPRVVENGWSAQ